jgi:hypothetical protein
MSVGKKRKPRFRVGEGVWVLFGTQKVAGEIVEVLGFLGGYRRRLYQVRINRGQEDEMFLTVSEEEIDRPDEDANGQETKGNRQEIDVTYSRPNGTNRWTATTKRGRLYRGIKARGVVGYYTGRWEGERVGEENKARVTVFVECDPPLCDSHARVRPTSWPILVAKARELADRRFTTRHPDAVIEHIDGDE